MLRNKVFFCAAFLFFELNQLVSHPISSQEDAIYIQSQLGTYRLRFLILSQNIEPKFAKDLNSLIERFDAAINNDDLVKNSILLDNFMGMLNPDFANYLQYELDVQLLDEDMNFEIWFFEQLLSQIEDADLAADISHLLPYYEIARNTHIIDKKYEVFASIESEISQRLLSYLDMDPIPAALLNVHLQIFREFLLHLLEKSNVGVFEDNIKASLSDIEKALGENDIPYKQKAKLLDRFDDVTSDFGRFLDANVHEFEIYKFGRK